MTKKFRAIVIDPKKVTVEMVETTGTHEDTRAMVCAIKK
jgi:hypothetical protein